MRTLLERLEGEQPNTEAGLTFLTNYLDAMREANSNLERLAKGVKSLVRKGRIEEARKRKELTLKQRLDREEKRRKDPKYKGYVIDTKRNVEQIMDMVKLAQKQGNWEEWYERSEESIGDMFAALGLKDPGAVQDVFFGTLAATSQQTPVKRNVVEGIDSLRKFIDGATEAKQFKVGMSDKKKNVARAIAGVPLTGPKIGEYYKNVTGDKDAIAVDTHIFGAIFDEPELRDPNVPKKKRKRKRETDKRNIAKLIIAEAADRLGLDNRQVQAAVWASKQILDDAKVVSARSGGSIWDEPGDYSVELAAKENKEKLQGIVNDLEKMRQDAYASKGPVKAGTTVHIRGNLCHNGRFVRCSDVGYDADVKLIAADVESSMSDLLESLER